MMAGLCVNRPMRHDPPTFSATDLRPGRGVLRRLPLAVIVVVAILGAVFWRDALSFEALAVHHEALMAYRDAHYMLSVIGFIGAYALLVGLSLPGALVATLAGGFLFGAFPGVLYNVLGATLGALGIFLAARAGIGADISRRIAAGTGAAARLQTRLRENEWSVLFLMRLLPVVPFFMANLIPAFVGVAFHRFAISTFLGIFPGGLAITLIGAGLEDAFARSTAPDLSILFAPQVLWPMLGLSALSALPILIRALRRKKG